MRLRQSVAPALPHVLRPDRGRRLWCRRHGYRMDRVKWPAVGTAVGNRHAVHHHLQPRLRRALNDVPMAFRMEVGHHMRGMRQRDRKVRFRAKHGAGIRIRPIDERPAQHAMGGGGKCAAGIIPYAIGRRDGSAFACGRVHVHTPEILRFERCGITGITRNRHIMRPGPAVAPALPHILRIGSSRVHGGRADRMRGPILPLEGKRRGIGHPIGDYVQPRRAGGKRHRAGRVGQQGVAPRDGELIIHRRVGIDIGPDDFKSGGPPFAGGIPGHIHIAETGILAHPRPIIIIRRIVRHPVIAGDIHPCVKAACSVTRITTAVAVVKIVQIVLILPGQEIGQPAAVLILIAGRAGDAPFVNMVMPREHPVHAILAENRIQRAQRVTALRLRRIPVRAAVVRRGMQTDKRHRRILPGILQLVCHPFVLLTARLPVRRGSIRKVSVVIQRVAGRIVGIQADDIAWPVPEGVIPLLPIGIGAAVVRIVAYRLKPSNGTCDAVGAITRRERSSLKNGVVSDHHFERNKVAHTAASLIGRRAPHLGDQLIPVGRRANIHLVAAIQDKIRPVGQRLRQDHFHPRHLRRIADARLAVAGMGKMDIGVARRRGPEGIGAAGMDDGIGIAADPVVIKRVSRQAGDPDLLFITVCVTAECGHIRLRRVLIIRQAGKPIFHPVVLARRGMTGPPDDGHGADRRVLQIGSHQDARS